MHLYRMHITCIIIIHSEVSTCVTFSIAQRQLVLFGGTITGKVRDTYKEKDSETCISDVC